MTTIVGIGEILWDLLPAGKQLGGAPANFAYHAAMLGNRGVVASRVGDDELGREIRELLSRLADRVELSAEHLQTDPEHPTGTVDVELGDGGQPSYTINQGVAWDHMAWTAEWLVLAESCDAVCFGSLAQRSTASRQAIQHFLRATRPGCLRVFDVNLRQAWYSAEVIRDSLALASLMKLNDDELPVVAELVGLPFEGETGTSQRLAETFDLEGVVVTRGANGALLVTPAGDWETPGIAVTVADTVGAGDSFTAALVHHWLEGSAPEEMLAAANRLGAWVASQSGATPSPDEAVLREIRG